MTNHFALIFHAHLPFVRHSEHEDLLEEDWLFEALTIGLSNTAVGRDALLRNTTGSSNVAVGYGTNQNLTTGNNNFHICNAGVAGEANKIHLDTVGIQNRTFIAGILMQPTRTYASKC